MKNPEDIIPKIKSPRSGVFTVYFSDNLVYNLLLKNFRLDTQIPGFLDYIVGISNPSSWASFIM